MHEVPNFPPKLKYNKNTSNHTTLSTDPPTPFSTSFKKSSTHPTPHAKPSSTCVNPNTYNKSPLTLTYTKRFKATTPSRLSNDSKLLLRIWHLSVIHLFIRAAINHHAE